MATLTCIVCETNLCEGQCLSALTPENLRERLDSIRDEAERVRFISHLTEAYDRSLRLLEHACQHEGNLEQLADALEINDRTNEHIRLGGSGMGLMAGVTGVGSVAAPAATAVHIAAAATLVAAAPQLLIASIVLGGTAACTTLGHELTIRQFEKRSPTQQKYKHLLDCHNIVRTIAAVADDLKAKSAAAKCTTLVVYGPLINPFEAALKRPTETSLDRNKDKQVEEEYSEVFHSPEAALENRAVLELECKDISDAEENNPSENTNGSTETGETGKDLRLSESVDQSTIKPLTPCTESEELPLSEMNCKADKQAKNEGKGSLTSCLVPLFPMVDDVILTVCGVFANPNAAARVAANAAKIAQVASIACGAFSVFTIAHEVGNIIKSLKQLEGPSSQAQMIRNLPNFVKDMADTNAIVDIFHRDMKHKGTEVL